MNLRLDPSILTSRAKRSDHRLLVIDSYRTWCCGTWVGDLTVEWRASPPGGSFVAVAPVEGVAVFVRERLVRLLDAAGATVARSRLPFSAGLRIELDRAELWIDYLDRPLAWVPPGGSRPSP